MSLHSHSSALNGVVIVFFVISMSVYLEPVAIWTWMCSLFPVVHEFQVFSQFLSVLLTFSSSFCTFLWGAWTCSHFPVFHWFHIQICPQYLCSSDFQQFLLQTSLSFCSFSLSCSFMCGCIWLTMCVCVCVCVCVWCVCACVCVWCVVWV